MKFINKLKYTRLYEMVLPFIHRRDLTRWRRSRKNSPTPHLIKQNLVKQYAKKSGLTVFVETGTYLGTMTKSVQKVFDEIYTIELDQKLYQRAKSKFKMYKKIKVLQGNSANVIKKVLKDIKGPALFWLDAHYSAGITSGKGSEVPVLSELEHILKHRVKGHTVLIDDANLFDGTHGYPKLVVLKSLIKKFKKNLTFKKINNILVLEIKN